MLRSNLKRVASALLCVGGLAAHGGAHAAFGDNLLVNPGAEAATGGSGEFIAGSLPGWTVTGELTNIAYALGGPLGYPTEADPGPDDRALNMFGGGNAGSSHGTQSVDLGFATSLINGAGARFQLSGWLGGYASQEDHASLSVTFLDDGQNALGGGVIGPVSAAERGGITAMLYRQLGGWVPNGATQALVDLAAIRTGGTSNDGYADSLSLSILPANVLVDAPAMVTVGDAFAVTVSALDPFGGSYDGDELLAFGFDLDFDTSILALSGVTLSGWDDDSGLFDDVDVAGSTFPSILDDNQATLELATLFFVVIGEGQALIDVHSNTGGSLNQGLTYLNGANVDLFGRAQLTAIPAAPVPLPASWLLLGGALGLLSHHRRHRRLHG